MKDLEKLKEREIKKPQQLLTLIGGIATSQGSGCPDPDSHGELDHEEPAPVE